MESNNCHPTANHTLQFYTQHYVTGGYTRLSDISLQAVPCRKWGGRVELWCLILFSPVHSHPSPNSPAPSSVGNNVEEVIHPCNPNPCPSNHLCQVNRKGCLDELNCQPYVCVPGMTPSSHSYTKSVHCSMAFILFVCSSSGCKLGEASDFLVQQDAHVQVPTRTGPAGCYEMCSCGSSGHLENCVEMPCLDINKPCIVGGQRRGKSSFIVLGPIYSTRVWG